MQKTTKFLISLIFITILYIGVGYAAINNIVLNISGTIETAYLISPDILETVFYYVGYQKDNKVISKWNPGDLATNLVLHYDGICNYFDKSVETIGHKDGLTKWYDLSGQGFDGKIVSSTPWRLLYNDTTVTEVDNRNEGTGTSSFWTGNSLSLAGDNYVLCDFVNNGRLDINEITKPAKQSFTYEIVFYNNRANTSSKALIGNGYYPNCNENEFWINPTATSGARTVCPIEGATSSSDTNTYPLDTKYKAAYGDGATDNFREGHVQKQDVDGIGNWTYDEVSSWVFGLNNKDFRSRYAGYETLSNRYAGLYNYLFSTNAFSTIFRPGAVIAYYTETLWTNRFNYTFVIRARNNNENYSRALFLPSDSNNNIKMQFWGQGNDHMNRNSNISEGKHSISVTYDNSTRLLTIYLDGQKILEETKSTASHSRMQEITIGAVNYSINSLFNSNAIDLQFQYQIYLNSEVYAVRIYDRALNGDEIGRNFIIDNARFNIKSK